MTGVRAYARPVDPLIALTVVLGVVAAATLAGVALRARDGRLRTASGNTTFEPAADASVTLLQFSTQYCSRCPGVRRMLLEVAGAHPGVAHREIDLTDRPELASEYRILQTPTTLVLDRGGRVAARIAGVPRRRDLEARLATLTEGAS